MHISRYSILVTVLLFFLTMQVLIAVDYFERHKSLEDQNQSVYLSIYSLQQNIGYVGLIHHFKNYVLRNEEVYRNDAIESFKRAIVDVEQLERIHLKLFGHAFSMTQTRSMLQQYADNLDQIRELHAKALSIDEIDTTVVVNDTPANQEIKKISTDLKARLTLQRDQLVTRSLTMSVSVFAGLAISILLLLRFFTRQQQEALAESQALNDKLNRNQEDIAKSQTTLMSVMDDVNRERMKTTELNTLLKQKNKEMEQFVYTVSHDLKSPLVTIAGFAKSIEKELREQLNEKQTKRFQRIHANVDHMEGLLSDLLDISRIIQKQIEKEPVELAPIVESLENALQSELDKTSGEIVVANELSPVFATPRFVQQALQNLISNALRYKHLERAPRVTISTEISDTSVILHVEDNGMGIAEEYFERIFKIFERISEDQQGTGVGLTIVKTIMDRLEGSILLESQLGVGTKFSLVFPKAGA